MFQITPGSSRQLGLHKQVLAKPKARLEWRQLSMGVQSKLRSSGILRRARSDSSTLYNKDIRNSGLAPKIPSTGYKSLSKRKELNSAQNLLFHDRW